MLENVSKIDRFLIIFTTVILFLSPVLRHLDESIQLVIFIVIMVTTGIPHGSVDHVIHRHVMRARNLKVSWPRFFGLYLGLMAAYLVVWLIFPAVGAIIFFFLSAYHFGESQLFYLKFRKSKGLLQTLVFTLWGGVVVLLLMWTNADTTYGYLSKAGITGSLTMAAFTEGTARALVIFSIAMLVAFAWLRMNRLLSSYQLLMEGLYLVIFAILFYTLPPLLSFSIYFGFWHSLKVMFTELDYLKQEDGAWNFKRLVREMMPFSIISIVGIGLVILAMNYLPLDISPILILFIAISILTAPHAFFTDQMYVLLDRNK